MFIATSLSDIPSMPGPLGLTIGSFDGLHPGHLFLLQELRKKVGKGGAVAVITFSNHPASVLKKISSKAIVTLDHKLRLLEQAGVDLVIVLSFSLELSDLTYDQFLNNIRVHYPFSVLMLGEGAFFGKERKGDEPHVKALGVQVGFDAVYVKKLPEYASANIRPLIEKGDFAGIKKLLSRPYSLYTFLEGNTVSLKDLCLLPEGDYALSLLQNGKKVETTGHVSHSPPALKIQDPSQEGFVEIVFNRLQ